MEKAASELSLKMLARAMTRDTDLMSGIIYAVIISFAVGSCGIVCIWIILRRH